MSKQQQININKVTMDLSPYTADLNHLREQFQRLSEADKSIDNQPTLNPNELDVLIRANIDEHAKVLNELRQNEYENHKLKRELKLLQKSEEIASRARKQTMNVINSSYDEFVESANRKTCAANLIETKLGIKLKLTQSDQSIDTKHLWTARFIFDAGEKESRKYAVIVVDTRTNSYTLSDMKPKPQRFNEMISFLSESNDLTGFLYSCWRLFKLKGSADEKLTP